MACIYAVFILQNQKPLFAFLILRRKKQKYMFNFWQTHFLSFHYRTIAEAAHSSCQFCGAQSDSSSTS